MIFQQNVRSHQLPDIAQIFTFPPLISTFRGLWILRASLSSSDLIGKTSGSGHGRSDL